MGEPKTQDFIMNRQLALSAITGLIGIISILGCSPKTAGSSCNCTAGTVCSNGACLAVCIDDRGCASGQICDQGVCAVGVRQATTLQLVCTSPAPKLSCVPCRLSPLAVGDKPGAPDSNMSVSVQGSPQVLLYSDFTCGAAVSSFELAAGSSDAVAFYLTPQAVGSVALNTTNSGSLNNATATINVTPIAPTSATLSANQPLARTEYVDSSGVVIPNSGGLSYPSNTGASDTLAPTPATLLAAPGTDVNAALPAVPANTPTTASVLDATSTYGIELHASANFPAGANPACRFPAPYDSLSCSLSATINLLSSGLLADDLTVVAYAANGDSTDTLVSNSIESMLFHFDRVMYAPSDPSGSYLDITGGVVFGGDVYFSADAWSNSDVLQAGTRWFRYRPSSGNVERVTDFSTLALGSPTSTDGPWDTIIGATVYNNRLYASADYGKAGVTTYERKLVRFTLDGAGNLSVEQLTDFTPGGDDNIVLEGVHGGELYFKSGSDSQLHTFDDSGDVTTHVSTKSGTGDLTEIGGCLYFEAYASPGYEKLYSDCSGNIEQRANINSGGSDNVIYITGVGGKVFFAANSGTGTKLFRLDPSSNVLTQITDFNPSGSDGILYLTALKDHLLFRGTDGGSSSALYDWNDTTSSLTRVTPASVTAPMFLHASSIANRVFFFATTASGPHTFSWDPTTTALRDYDVSAGGAYAVLDGRLFFFGLGLYFWDASNDKLVQVSDRFVTLVGQTQGDIILSMDDPAGNSQLYRLRIE